MGKVSYGSEAVCKRKRDGNFEDGKTNMIVEWCVAWR